MVGIINNKKNDLQYQPFMTGFFKSKYFENHKSLVYDDDNDDDYDQNDQNHDEQLNYPKLTFPQKVVRNFTVSLDSEKHSIPSILPQSILNEQQKPKFQHRFERSIMITEEHNEHEKLSATSTVSASGSATDAKRSTKRSSSFSYYDNDKQNPYLASKLP